MVRIGAGYLDAAAGAAADTPPASPARSVVSGGHSNWKRRERMLPEPDTS
jgi:hypothetical protein